jgi:hypothetical protein
MNSKNKNIRDLFRGINGFKRGYKPRSNLVKDENGDLVADSYNIMNSWKNHLFQLLNIHRFSDVKQVEIHTAEPVVSNPIHVKVEIAVSKLKYKSRGSVQISAELYQAGTEILWSENHKLISSVWNKE